jgi:hypothetical protein
MAHSWHTARRHLPNLRGPLRVERNDIRSTYFDFGDAQAAPRRVPLKCLGRPAFETDGGGNTAPVAELLGERVSGWLTGHKGPDPDWEPRARGARPLPQSKTSDRDRR